MAVETHTGEAIYVPDLARERRIIKEAVFEDCLLFGPAVIALLGSIQLRRIAFNEAPEEFFWAYEANRPYQYIGCIGVEHCLFEECRFENIGILTSTQGQDDIRAALI